MPLKRDGIAPDFCLDHGMTLSYFERAADGNYLELEVENAETVRVQVLVGG